MTTRTLLLVLLLAGCGRSSTPVEASPAASAAEGSSRTRIEPAVDPAPPERPTPAPAADAPDSVPAIAELLGARHAADLPTRQTLDAHPVPDEALAWLALNADQAAVKVRATRLLGLYSERDHGPLLGRLAGVDAPHPTIRAAALDALGAYPVARRRAHADTIRVALDDGDPRVAAAAGRAAEGLGL